MYYRPSISPQDIDWNEILSPRVVCTQYTTGLQSLHRILIKMRFWVQEWFVLNVLQTLSLSTGYWLKWDFESKSGLYSMYYRPSISPQDIDRNEILSPRVVLYSMYYRLSISPQDIDRNEILHSGKFCTQCTTDPQSLHRILILLEDQPLISGNQLQLNYTVGSTSEVVNTALCDLWIIQWCPEV